MSAVEKLPEDFCANPDVAWTFPKVSILHLKF